MHEPSVNVCLLLLISKGGSNNLWTFLPKARQKPAALPDCSAFPSPPIIALHAIYFPWSFYVPPTLLLFFTAKSFPPSSQKLVECHHVSPVQHSPTFCLCVSYTSAHWVMAAIIHLFISHADLLSHITSCKINIVSSMPVLHPSSCHVSSFPFVTCFFSVLCLIYFVE